MGKMKNEMMARCELALMGKVIPVMNNNEVNPLCDYILSAMGYEDREEDVLAKVTQFSPKNKVKYLVCNTVEGMKCITLLLDSGVTDKESEDYYPAPFEEDYGSGYPASFCYVFNAEVDWCSEFGDCFFEKRADGYYHRVS